MTVYNVSVSVVALVAATSPEEAISKLRTRLDRRGFVPRDDDGGADAFESEMGVEADVGLE